MTSDLKGARMPTVSRTYTIECPILRKWCARVDGHSIFDPGELKKDFPEDLVDSMTLVHGDEGCDHPTYDREGHQKPIVGVADLDFIEIFVVSISKEYDVDIENHLDDYDQRKMIVGRGAKARYLVNLMTGILDKMDTLGLQNGTTPQMKVSISARKSWQSGSATHVSALTRTPENLHAFVSDLGGNIVKERNGDIGIQFQGETVIRIEPERAPKGA